MFKPPTRPMLFILSGPSGVGKDAVLARLKASDYPMKYVTTLTTRPRRVNEKNDVDYHFISAERFQEMIKNNELLEWAEVYGNRYGVPKEPVKRAFGQGHNVMLKVDIQGVANIKKIVPRAISIFLMPSSVEELERRLKHRHTESAFDMSRRLKIAESEMKELPGFDYVIINREGEIDRAVADIKAIITAEKCRVTGEEIAL
ncbi:MAG: guanylate kinase [Chloroflexota bacterium]